EVFAHDGEADQSDITLIHAHFGISLIPPGVGVGSDFIRFEHRMAISVSLTDSALELPPGNDDPEAGAVVVFWGAVRAMEEGRELTGIEYEAHPTMAERQLQLVAEGATEKFGLRDVLLHHRIG